MSETTTAALSLAFKSIYAAGSVATTSAFSSLATGFTSRPRAPWADAVYEKRCVTLFDDTVEDQGVVCELLKRNVEADGWVMDPPPPVTFTWTGDSSAIRPYTVTSAGTPDVTVAYTAPDISPSNYEKFSV